MPEVWLKVDWWLLLMVLVDANSYPLWGISTNVAWISRANWSPLGSYFALITDLIISASMKIVLYESMVYPLNFLINCFVKSESTKRPLIAALSAKSSFQFSVPAQNTFLSSDIASGLYLTNFCASVYMY